MKTLLMSIGTFYHFECTAGIGFSRALDFARCLGKDDPTNLDDLIRIVAVERVDGWACYTSPWVFIGRGVFDTNPEDVKWEGDKLNEQMARFLFPEYSDKRYVL
jgi:hypothetical protein